MIQLRDVAVQAGAFRMSGMTLAIPQGAYGVILGAAGSGKTTLLECVAGVRAVASGSIRLGDADVTHQPPERRRVGMVYQHDYLFPHLSVGGNVRYGAADERAARDAAAMAGVEHLLARDVRTLSGGERQLVALARALATEPPVVLLDEPFAALDPPRRAATRRMLRRLQRERGISVLHVTHDVGEAALLADVVAVLDAGSMLQRGPATDVFSRPATPRVAELLGAENVLAVTAHGAEDGLVELRTGGLAIYAVAGEAPTTGQLHAVIRADEIVLARGAATSSARNSFSARLVAVSAGAPLARVELDVRGTALTAIVTGRAVAELGLVPGLEVTASFKATAVHLC